MDKAATSIAEKVGQETSANVEYAGQIGVQNRLPFFIAHRNHQADLRDARIANDDIDSIEIIQYLLDDRLDSMRISDIEMVAAHTHVVVRVRSIFNYRTRSVRIVEIGERDVVPGACCILDELRSDTA